MIKLYGYTLIVNTMVIVTRDGLRKFLTRYEGSAGLRLHVDHRGRVFVSSNQKLVLVRQLLLWS